MKAISSGKVGCKMKRGEEFPDVVEQWSGGAGVRRIVRLSSEVYVLEIHGWDAMGDSRWIEECRWTVPGT